MTTLMIARALNNSVRTSALRIQTALDAHVSRDVIWDAFNTWMIAVIVLLLLLVVVETFWSWKVSCECGVRFQVCTSIIICYMLFASWVSLGLLLLSYYVLKNECNPYSYSNLNILFLCSCTLFYTYQILTLVVLFRLCNILTVCSYSSKTSELVLIPCLNTRDLIICCVVTKLCLLFLLTIIIEGNIIFIYYIPVLYPFFDALHYLMTLFNDII